MQEKHCMDITISKYWQRFKDKLFPEPEIYLGNPTESHLELMLILDTIKIADFFNDYASCPGRGRPSLDRECFAKAFIAKSVLNLPTTVSLIDRLKVDIVLRRICGFINKNKLPCEASFSNAFKEFSKTKLAEKIHEVIIKKYHKGVLVHHISRDSTAIEVREKPEKKEAKIELKKRARGRPRKGEFILKKEPSILEKQKNKNLNEMLLELPVNCNIGSKKNSKGYSYSWIGYKLHIDTGDYGIPISCLLTSASVHDNNVSLPLEMITGNRISSLYTLMDSAYDSSIIKEDIIARGKVHVIEHNPRRGEKIEFDPPKSERYKFRAGAERTNALLKDSYGGNSIMVKSPSKVMCHLMFGIICISAMQIARAII
ncbi:hypothetical protein AXG55_12450 [Silvanigrella aquatica]|uniref:Transposase n=2 Tax=Silvanigrella aquatica TaxID=1915309 RepID=A0A1L4CZ50_9BACT|nr:hypothetical protein AXG55_02715 [Silvanigrella aquatica]APJ03229.1 hypothetical protein AXG55_04645 [Silvanigrella aquatica]APJ03919.1 hypothetical protein AXG55_08380 [Silvanigrella aquatica]APJ04669.1 hypothetical protein AXG55_12450 [Silvanigrella aquatica]